MDLDEIKAFKKKMDSIHINMTVEDFKRIHGKFFACIISTEEGFKKKFPDEWKEYERGFYGE